MKKLILLVMITCLAAALPAQTKTYRGEWFDIKYPSSFTVKPSMKSYEDNKQYLSAFFISPDREVEFYIYSPQWSGDPTDIGLTGKEKLSGSTTKTTGSVIITNWTIAAKDGSYLRSYEEKKDTLINTTRVFGIKYKNQAAYNKYKSKYLAFKSSLVQYGD